MRAFEKRTVLRVLAAALVLAAVSRVGAMRTGPLPPLGAFLDPRSGVWSVSTLARRPDAEAVVLPGLRETATVVYDDRAVPHIFANSSEDAARVLGYVQARDRLFQMEMRWRSAAGRISELVGASALEFDRGVRRLGLGWSAERDFSQLDLRSPYARDLTAYAEGVNAWIDGLDRRHLPLEYHLLGAWPAAWRPVFALYLLNLMGWDLTYTRGDLTHLRLQARVGPAAASALFPTHSPIQQPIQPNGEREARLDLGSFPPPGEPDLAAKGLADALEVAFGPLVDVAGSELLLGSNNWVVGPERSASGHALLAGDPHLRLTLPSIWYEAHLVVPGQLDVYGATIPSGPVIVIGFNRDVAWSFTNTGADVIDYYEEQLDDPDQPTSYLVDGEWRALDRRIEWYRGRGGRPLAVDTLYSTHRGPLVEEGERTLSMRWTVLEGSPETEALWRANRAGSVEEWLEAMAMFSAPAQNGAVADRSGDIAIRSTGHFPLHPDGDGLEVRDGSVAASDWVGYWSLDRYPSAINPAQGYLASANQQPIDPQIDPTYLGANWPSPWRAMRINGLLSHDSAATPESMRRYQTDPGNERAEMFVPFLVAAGRAEDGLEKETEVLEAARLLDEWDRLYTKDNTRAVLFEAVMSELANRTWDELRLEEEDGRGRRIFTPSAAVLAALLHHPGSEWWDDQSTDDRVEDRDAIIRASLAAALQRVTSDHGHPDGDEWRWDHVQRANIYHLLGASSLSALDLPIQGGDGTLNPSSGRGVYGASWRMVVELGPELRAWTTYPGGQSGNPLSPHYADRITSWVEGELDRVLFPHDRSDMDSSRVLSILELQPEGG